MSEEPLIQSTNQNENLPSKYPQEETAAPTQEDHTLVYTRETKFPTRLYISNVSYKISEEDLWELFKGYEVVYILVPTQTVKLSFKYQQRSFGVAYVDFKTQGEAQRAKEDLNGREVNGRSLHIKPFTPYKASKSLKKNVSKTYKKGKQGFIQCVEPANDQAESPGIESEVADASDEPATPDEEIGSPEVKEAFDLKNECSTDTIYIARLHPKVTDGDLREYFHVYGPTAVFIFKSYNKTKRFGFHNKYVSALVTLSVENGLEKALLQLKDIKLKGKRVKLDAAYKFKVEEVIKAARALEKKIQVIEEQPKQAATGAVAAHSASNAVADDVVVESNTETDETREPPTDAAPAEELYGDRETPEFVGEDNEPTQDQEQH